jgi:hypothetical protein
MSKRRNHKWTSVQEDILYNNKNLSPREIKESFFPHVDSITTQGIADKMSRIVDEREQANYGKPWTPEDEAWLKANMNLLSNEQLKSYLKRGSKELDQAKFDLRHTGEINPKYSPKKRVAGIPHTESEEMPNGSRKMSSKVSAKFEHRNGLVHFQFKTRVHGGEQGVRDLVKELRDAANAIESNKDFSV